MSKLSSPKPPLRVAIIGGGMSGISQAVGLVTSLPSHLEIKIFEKRSSLGGVWRDALWPGAGVDVPIHLYSLYSDPKADWTTTYAEQPEVLAYYDGLVDKYHLRGNFAFDTEYVGSEWHDSTQSHTLTLRRSDGSTYTHEAEIIISANGPLSTPQIPKIRGLDQFEGAYFHNLRWDPTVDFKNKRVAVVGNGSSGIQLIPGVAEIEGVKLTQFIRSGGYFIPKINTPYASLQIFAYKWVPFARRIHRFILFLESNDRWRARNEPAVRPTPSEVVLLDYLRKEAPPEYLEALTPSYPLGCKRPAFDYGWLKALHRPNVKLVSSSIAYANAAGLVTTDGREHPFDVIIFATGSNVAEHGVGVNIGLKGQEDVDLQTYWKRIGGPQAYLGTSVPRFPNYFAILGPNAICGSWGYTIGCKTAFNTLLIKSMVEHGVSSLQPSDEAFIRHNEEVQRRLKHSSMNSTTCTNWWRTETGRITVPNWTTGFQFARILRRIRWDDWIAVGTAGPDGQLITIHVGSRIRRARATRVGLTLLTILGTVLLVRSVGAQNTLAQQAVDTVRTLLRSLPGSA